MTTYKVNYLQYMNLLKTDFLTPEQTLAVCRLWNAEYPEKLCFDAVADFENYLSKLSDQKHYILNDQHDALLAWALEFTRDAERWFAVIVTTDFHAKGLGTELLNTLKQNNSILNAWVIDHDTDLKLNGTVYKSPLAFYVKNGFEVLDTTRLNTDVIKAVKIRSTKISAKNLPEEKTK